MKNLEEEGNKTQRQCLRLFEEKQRTSYVYSNMNKGKIIEMSQSNRRRMWTAHVEAIVRSLAFTLYERRWCSSEEYYDLTCFKRPLWHHTWGSTAQRVMHVNTKLKMSLRIHHFYLLWCMLCGKRCACILLVCTWKGSSGLSLHFLKGTIYRNIYL